jgi:CheY-like chemotaxis protein
MELYNLRVDEACQEGKLKGMRTALEAHEPLVPRIEGVRVLIVEDEPDAREFLAELLAGRGARVDVASSVSEAYQSLTQGVPDVIVSDIGMPEIDGYQFARGLRELPLERGGRTPLVALTAYTSPQDRRRAFDAGFDHHLAKPVDTDELLRVLDQLVGARVT